MNRQKVLGWLLVGGALAAASCSVPRTHYYLLEYPHTPAASPSGPHSVAVQTFRADQVYVDDRIVFREGVNEVNHYEYHRWASPPEDLVTNYVVHRMNDSGAYSQVVAFKNGPQTDFILQGRIHHFEEVDHGKDVSVSVDLELELVNGKTRGPVWRSEATCSKPLGTRDLNGVTQGIHDCLEEATGKLLGEMQIQITKAGSEEIKAGQ